MRQSIDKVLAGIVAVTRQEILRDFRADSCIASTRTVIRVLRHFGYDATPLSVRVFVYNRLMVDALLKGTVKPDDSPEFRAWCDRSGAWSVGVGVPGGAVLGGKEGFGGHLVAALADRRLFVDASIDQANRPQKDILLPSVFVSRLTDPFITTPGETLEFQCETGAQMVYQRIENQFYRTSPDWIDKARTKRAVKAVINYIESETA